MTILKRYVLRLFLSLKYVTGLAMLRPQGLMGRSSRCGSRWKASSSDRGVGIHVDVTKEIEKKGLGSKTKVWAVVNALRSNGVKLILDDEANVTRTVPSQ